MLKAAIKFCGGCNPRYDRGEAYRLIRERVADVAAFESPVPGALYDFLLIIRGCTACPYLYEDEIDTPHRLVLTEWDGIDDIIHRIQALHK